MEFDITTFLLEIVNFLILIWILQRLFYKPVLAVINRRKQHIDQTLSEAQKLQQQTAENEANLAFKLSGQVKSISVKVGDEVKKGTRVASIDQGTLWNELSSAQNYLQAQRDTLYDMKKRDETYNNYQKDAQRALIKKAEDAVAVINTQIGQTTIYSPMAGVVTSKNIEVGENVAANQTVLTVSTTGETEIKLDVSESDIVDVKVGQKVKLTFDALSSDEELKGEVVEIDPAATVIQDVVYYKVKVKLSSPDERLKLGMSVDGDINVAQKDNVVMIPARAVKTEGNQDYVEILGEDNTTKKVNVSTGFKGDEGMVEITSGLQGGENVVVLSSEK